MTSEKIMVQSVGMPLKKAVETLALRLTDRKLG